MNTHHETSGTPASAEQASAQREARLARERAFFVYWNALERGDLETCERVLHLAAADAQLQRIIVEAHDLDLATPQVLEASERDAAQVRDLAAQIFSAPAFSAPIINAEEAQLAPLTVAQVAARMQADAAQSAGASGPREADALRRLSQLSAPVPDGLSPRGVRRFLEGLGFAASERVQAAFRETAIFLQMGRQQNVAQMAATRRARQSPTPPQDETAPQVLEPLEPHDSPEQDEAPEEES